MAAYQVVTIVRPGGWEPESPDDVPVHVEGPLAVLAESEDFFAAVRQAIEHNERADAETGGRWAAVIEPGTVGRVLPAARLCTPIAYNVTAIAWPEGWEPDAPLDVPNCVWHSREQLGQQWFSYEQAVATVGALNRQCMDRPGTTWYVVAAAENEAVSRTVSHDPAGDETTIELRRIHVLRPVRGGRGDCTCCPAHHLPCAQADWSSQMQTITTVRTRPADRDAASGPY